MRQGFQVWDSWVEIFGHSERKSSKTDRNKYLEDVMMMLARFVQSRMPTALPDGWTAQR